MHSLNGEALELGRCDSTRFDGTVVPGTNGRWDQSSAPSRLCHDSYEHLHRLDENCKFAMFQVLTESPGGNRRHFSSLKFSGIRNDQHSGSTSGSFSSRSLVSRSPGSPRTAK